MSKRVFRHYVFPRDEDVVFVGLDRWIERDDNGTVLLGPFLADVAEVEKRFDELEADLRRCRRETIAAITKINVKAGRRP